ncbi:MAG: trigger factor, partial [Demequinaceae bacterium]|nr:trigger factor [Demequinaceae bacterium]
GAGRLSGCLSAESRGAAVTSVIETIDATSVKITVSLTEKELAHGIEHAYEHLGKNVNIPGFRKGKVPTRVLEQHIGKGAALEHAINDGLARWYADAVEEHDLRPIGKPEIDVLKIPGQVEGDDGFSFIATVEVRPVLALPALESITLKVKPAEVSDEDVTARLDALRARFGTLVGVDRPAASGDFVTLDLVALIDGSQVDAVQGTSYEVGSGSMLEGLDDAIIGLSADEETSYEGALAAGEHTGEKALIRVKVAAVKRRELPNTDDEFAQLASEYDTLEELKADLRKQAAGVQVNNQAVEARVLLLERLESARSFDLPRKTVEAEVNEHLAGEGRLKDDAHRAEVTAEAEKSLRSQIVLDQLADDLDIVVEEEELLDYMIDISRSYGIDPEEFIVRTQRSGRVPMMVAEVARSKAVAFALRRVKVQDTKGAVVDLTEVVGSEESDARRAEVAEKFKAQRAEAAAARRPRPKSAAKKPAAKKPAARKPAAKKPAAKKK